ncbi:MAG: hypothetical protein HYZ73_01920 [Elusimicrobia bacterium]|nr:hypothetical protein [Elusimicrobiota bacterium]
MPTPLKLGVSYLGNRFLKHAARDLAEISEVCDYVVHTFSEADLYFHKKAMERLFAASRRVGLTVWADPWGFGGVCGGEAVSKFLLDHPSAWQMLSNGERVPAACLNNPTFRGVLKEWLLHAANFGAQTVLWDEPHPYLSLDLELQGIYTCTCPTCQALFRQSYGEAPPPKLTPEARQFRLQTMRNFLQDLMTFAHRKRLTNVLTIYAFQGIPEYDELWEQAAALPALDSFGCDPYWRWRRRRNPRTHVGMYAAKVVASCRARGKEPHLWLQAMRLPTGAESEIAEAAEAAVAAGVRNLAAWSYDGGELLDGVLSARPRRVWKAVVSAFQRLRRSYERHTATH